MENQKNIFLTGITGFLGSFLAKELLEKGYKIYGLARAKGGITAEQRVREALKFVYEDDWDEQFIKDNLTVVEGDITYEGLGIKDESLRNRLIAETDIIIHNAALVEVKMPLDIIRGINVEGTRHVLEFAMQCKEKGRLQKLNHISTMYVVGTKEIDFDETMLDVGQGFYSTYEQSKFEAELLINEYASRGLNVSIFRPSMVIGDTMKGKTNNFRLLYQPLHYFANEIFDKFPGNIECFQNFINVDTVALSIASLAEREQKSVYHLIGQKDIKIGLFMELAAGYFCFRMPEFIPLEKFDFNELTFVQRALARPFYPYFNYRTKFSAQYTFNILTKHGFEFPALDRDNFFRVFEYCISARFIIR